MIVKMVLVLPNLKAIFQSSRYKYWPFQIMVTQKQRSSKDKGIEEPETQIYQCYVDASQLLFPGSKVTKIKKKKKTL